MKLIITRHGETEENKAGILQGHLPGKLSSLGIEQAKKLAIRFKDERIDYIYSSDLDRAADTAKEIAKYHSDTPIEFTQELRERDIGEYTGVDKATLGVPKDVLLVATLDIKEGELHKQLIDRAKSFYDKIFEKHQNDTVLFVTHNTFNRFMVSVVMNEPFEEIEKQSNAGIHIFEIDNNKVCNVIVFNDTEHLNG